MNLKQFLIIYKETNKLQAIPSPTIDHDIQFVFDAVNGVPPSNRPRQQLLIHETGKDYNDRNVGGNVDAKDVQDEEMSTAEDEYIVGGKYEIRRLTFNTIVSSVYNPIKEFYDQCKMNKEEKRIKAAMVPVRVNDTASGVATILGHDQPTPQPILQGLVEETTAKKTKDMECRIQLLEDKLKAANSKKVRGNGMEPKNILRKGTPIAEKTTAPKTSATPRKSQKGCGANNSDTKPGNQKLKEEGQKVSFGGKKGARAPTCANRLCDREGDKGKF